VRILADVNVPNASVSALRGDGHDVMYSRNEERLGPTATDTDIVEHAEREDVAVLSTDVKDFSGRDVGAPVFVAPQDMTGDEVRAAISHRIDGIRSGRCRSDLAVLAVIRADLRGTVRNH
jgi:predicted nuclease of predicted toxin-antitoxin system